MSIENFNIRGLNDDDVLASREANGTNQLDFQQENELLGLLKDLLKEPMVLLLLVASVIYFISGDIGDGVFLALAVVLVASISIYQDSKSRDALEQLKKFTQANCKVIRNGEVVEIKSEELVLGDSLLIEEGTTIAADGTIIHSNDFSVIESILTGESMPVNKNPHSENHFVYRGTTVVSGLAIALITAIGNQTEIGKIGKSLESIEDEKTPLEIQINDFVKKMVVIGAIVFLIVWAINFFNSNDVLDSLLNALTLAMSILPEEIPVAFTTFMALGAWRLMKMGIVVKQMKTVETLGGATVVCVDKTGTITENKMNLARLFVLSSKELTNPEDELTTEEKELITVAMWASEPIPFDPMEIVVHESYSRLDVKDVRANYQMIHEYPLGGKPPMMTHLFENEAGQRIIATKGAAEAIMEVSQLSDEEKRLIESAMDKMSAEGYRVLGVAKADFDGSNFPVTQQEFPFQFKGLVAFYDPPKKNIPSVLDAFDKAGIGVKIVTGDNALTTRAIARQVGFKGHEKSMSGDELMTLSDTELERKVLDIQVFTRMFPAAKLRIINALKANNEIVAMTGDGVNDGPALKAAHIGIAMGKKGTEIAKQAASLILADDDLSKMVDAIAMGRKIYTSLKKAIQYVISIHIPIILTVFIPLALGWIYPNIFSPVHVILMELIMGPTCSIIYENEPIEKNTMTENPRPFTNTFFDRSELMTSVIQGLMITVGVLVSYQYAVAQGYNEALTRAMVFTTLISSNVFLTLINRSFYYSIFTTLKYKNNLVGIIISITVALTAMLLFVKPLTRFFEFETLNGSQLGIAVLLGFLFVIWYEVVKWGKRNTVEG